MALMRYDPWSTLRQIQSDLDRFFPHGVTREADEAETAGNWLPAVDISEDEKAYHIHADLPGVSPDDIDVSMDKGMLTIKGSRQSEHTESGKDYKRVERVHGSFFRRFTLPDNVDPERIQARSNHGVLEVTVPKREEEPAKRIQVEKS